MRLLLTLLFVVGAAGCTAERALLVQLSSDMAPGREIDLARVELMGPEGEALGTFDAPLTSALGRPTRIANFRDLGAGVHRVVVTLLLDGRVIQTRRVSRDVVGISVVTVLMTRDCNGVSCPAGDPSAVECLGGRCVPSTCDEEHPELCPVPECATDGDCSGSEVSCAPLVCSPSGTCFVEADDGLCAVGQVCDSDLGCLDLAGADAGPPPMPMPCDPGLIPSPLGGCTRVVSVGVGFYHSCALGTEGQVACWGSNQFGVLGVSPDTLPASSRPVLVPGLRSVTAIAVGGRHVCAVSDGAVYCWGAVGASEGMYLGQLGHGGDSGSATPVAVPGLLGIVSLATTHHTTCALTAAGTATCWGYGPAIGNGAIVATQLAPGEPVASTELGMIAALEGGADHFCATSRTDGSVWCWGSNGSSKAGDAGGSTTVRLPLRVGALSGATSLVVGDEFSCARLADSSVWCWGAGPAASNCTMDPGPPPSTSCIATATPGRRMGFAPTVVFGGAAQICGLESDAPRCLGGGRLGRLGDGVDHTEFFVATPVSLLAPASSAVFIDFGLNNGCALLGDGKVACWGANGGGELGNGTFSTLIPSVPGLIAPMGSAGSK